jgi:transcription elongation factor GreA
MKRSFDDMADKRVLLTADGLKKLQEKLDFLKGERRQEVAARLKAAIALGDLSENSEYDDAKNEQAFLEGEILELEESIRNSKIIEASADSNTVSLGAQVVLKDIEFDEVDTYMLVGATEADPDNGKISNESPVGLAIMGQPVGSVVDVVVGENVIQYQIMEIKN